MVTYFWIFSQNNEAADERKGQVCFAYLLPKAVYCYEWVYENSRTIKTLYDLIKHRDSDLIPNPLCPPLLLFAARPEAASYTTTRILYSQGIKIQGGPIGSAPERQLKYFFLQFLSYTFQDMYNSEVSPRKVTLH